MISLTPITLRELALKENIEFKCSAPDREDIDLLDSNTGKVLGVRKNGKTGYLELNDAILTFTGCVIYKNYIIVEGIRHNIYNWYDRDINDTFYSNLFSKNSDGKINVDIEKATIKYIDDTFVNLSSMIPQVGHFQIDTLAQHIMYEHINCNKIVMRKPFECSYSMVNFLLNFYFPHKEVLHYEHNVFFKFKKLYVMETCLRDTLYSDFVTDRYGVEKVKDKIDNLIDSYRDSTYSKNIFIDRGDGINIDDRHNVTNRHQMLELLNRYNYKIINVSDLSLEEQIKTFANAVNVCGVHGSGFGNSILQRRNTNIIEIDWRGNRIFGGLFLPYGLNWYKCNSITTDHPDITKSTMMVDLEDLEGILSRLQ
jgi:hypothetical protein